MANRSYIRSYIRSRIVLLSLLCAFLNSALILPLANSPSKERQEERTVVGQTSNHASPNSSPTLPGEEKEEEETRAEKDSKDVAAILHDFIELSLIIKVETVNLRFEELHSVQPADVPIYVLKKSLLI